MPRKTISFDEASSQYASMTEKLSAALTDSAESGQPMIYEQELAPGRRKITVVWDEWQEVPLAERTSIILRAYELAEGSAFRDQIALASGLTVPEATSAGMLPYQITTALRKDDPFTFQECRDAMLAEGGSTLFGPGILQLRFPTRAEAEAGRHRLSARLPKSDNIWLVQIDVSVQDHLSFEDSASVGAR